MAKIKRFIPLALLCFGLSAAAAEAPFAIRIGAIKGMDTYHAPQTLAEDNVRDAENVNFDEDAAAKKREGKSLYLTLGTSASVRGLWPYKSPAGTDYMMILSSDSLYSYDNINLTLVHAGFDPTKRMDAVSALGSIWFTDKSTTVFYWNGSSITWVPAAPKGQYVETYRNRLVMGDVTGSASSIYLSGELHGDDWTTGNLSTSAVTWRAGGVDDARNRILCLKAGYADFLMIGTEDKTFGFYGNDQRNFNLRQLFNDTGCTEDGTVEEFLGGLQWVSKYGLERFDRNVLLYPRVSEPVRDTMDALISAGGTNVQWTQTTQTDFEAGTSAGLSTVITPASVVLSTWGAVDTSSSDFVAGTITNLSTTTTDGSLTLAVLKDFSLENFSGFWAQTSVCCAAIQSNARAHNGTYSGLMVVTGAPPVMKLVLSSDNFTTINQVGADFGATASGAWTQITVSLTAYQGQTVRLGVMGNPSSYPSGSTLLRAVDPIYCAGGNVTFWVYNDGSGTWYIDQFEGPAVTYKGSFTSQTFDTALSSPAWGSTGASWTVTNGSSITFRTQTSTAASGPFEAAVSWSTGTAPASSWNRYFRYLISVDTPTAAVTSLTHIDDVTLAGRQSSGTFISQIKNFGTELTSFGNFEANTNGAGTYQYMIRTATSVAMITNATWVSQTPFTNVSASTNPYGQVKSTITITNGDQAPALNDFTINYNTGGSRPILVSKVFRDRYHLFYTTNSAADSYNTHALPLNRNLQWNGRYTNMGAASAVVWGRHLYIGDSQNTGKIYQLYSGNDDAGAAISAYVQFKDYDAGNEDAFKYFDKLYLTADHETEATQDVDIDVTYTIDGSATSYSLGSFNLSETEGRINAHVPFSVDTSNLNYGKWISPRVSNSGINEPFSLFGIRIYGTVEEVQ